MQNSRDLFFSGKTKTRQGCTTQKSGLGMQQQVGYHNPNIQISNLEVPVGMVDGILTKLRNPVNQDSWLTDRFSTSVNHALFLSLSMMFRHCEQRCNKWPDPQQLARSAESGYATAWPASLLARFGGQAAARARTAQISLWHRLINCF